MYAREVDEYIKNQESIQQQMLISIRALVHHYLPSVEECIKWRMPMFILPDFGDIFGMAAYSKHIGLYPQPQAVSAFAKELKDYHTSKGAIQFPLDQELPLSLIQQILDFRLTMLREKKKLQ